MDTTLENYTANAESFAQRWLNRGDEKSDTATFWLELLHDVLGVEKPGEFIEFEKRVELSQVSFIDPLFMNELEEKFKSLKALKPGQKVTALKGKPKREDALRTLQEELASLNFLDIKTPRLIQFNYSTADFAA